METIKRLAAELTLAVPQLHGLVTTTGTDFWRHTLEDAAGLAAGAGDALWLIAHSGATPTLIDRCLGYAAARREHALRQSHHGSPSATGANAAVTGLSGRLHRSTVHRDSHAQECR